MLPLTDSANGLRVDTCTPADPTTNDRLQSLMFTDRRDSLVGVVRVPLIGMPVGLGHT